MDGYEHSHNELEALRSIFQETSPFVGEEYLKALVKGLGECLKADTTFIAYALDDPPARVRGITAWKNGAFRESWDYDLAGNPCELTYNGHPTFIPSDLAAQFPAKSDSNYESYLGAPLFGDGGDVIGHIAVYSAAPHNNQSYALDLVRLCGFRAEAEVRRLVAEYATTREIAELRDSDQRKTEVVQTVSHELRTPLSSVIGYLSLLETGDLPPPIDSYASSAMEGAERLLHFINQQLDLERIVTGQSNHLPQDLDLSEIAQAAVKQFAPIADPFGIEIRYSNNGPLPAIKSERGHIQRLFDNLLSNAVKFSPTHGLVEIRLSARAGSVEISVSDQGAGIPEYLQDRVFERFSRAPAPDNRKLGGTGLGLSIAKAIVDELGGEIGFSTSSSGTTFVATLPVST